MIDAERLDVTRDDLEPVLRALFLRQEAGFKDWYDECSEPEQDILYAVADHGTSPANQWQTPAQRMALQRLLQDWLLEQTAAGTDRRSTSLPLSADGPLLAEQAPAGWRKGVSF